MATAKFIILGLCLLLFMPALKAQSISVFGGNEKAFDCYQHALLTDALDSVITMSMIEDCDFALENVLLDRRDKAATLTNRAILRYRRKNYQQAFADFETAINLQPEIAEIYVNRGNAYYMTEQYALALEDYALALSLGISEVRALYLNTGMAHEKLGNAQQARDSYERALEVSPDWSLARQRLDRLIQQ